MGRDKAAEKGRTSFLADCTTRRRLLLDERPLSADCVEEVGF
jgi:hypothetical protein